MGKQRRRANKIAKAGKLRALKEAQGALEAAIVDAKKAKEKREEKKKEVEQRAQSVSVEKSANRKVNEPKSWRSSRSSKKIKSAKKEE